MCLLLAEVPLRLRHVHCLALLKVQYYKCEMFVYQQRRVGFLFVCLLLFVVVVMGLEDCDMERLSSFRPSGQIGKLLSAPPPLSLSQTPFPCFTPLPPW